MNEETIFLEAIQKLSLEERAEFLDEACAGRVDLRLDVLSLLQAHDKAGGFLCGRDDEQTTKEGPGRVIGPYKLLEQIGEGGFGIVYMAEQQHPVRRRVALKILKPGMDSRKVIARFEAERQALALMHHPNIAQVFDGGETPSSRPYFVMELVRGIPITEFCEKNQQGINERLELFVSVCRAVQHAHQKGIIHRDLKPTNVLVTWHDDKPVAKVIDFGIAKATREKLTDKTLFTGFTQMIGTPMYMSPEQAQMNVLDVDTRSDIYSLGVLLYELLTGDTPFDTIQFNSASYDEMLRMIREDEPVRPSMRISTVAKAATTILGRPNTFSNRLTQRYRGELDWIVMKCLEKDRARRYEMASDLARDIERYLHSEPINACPPSGWYRLKKFCYRHRTGVFIGSLTFCFLLLLGGMAAWNWWNQSAQHAKASASILSALDEAQLLRREGKWRESQTAAQRALTLVTSLDGDASYRKEVNEVLSDANFCVKLEEVRMLRTFLNQGRFNIEGEDRGYSEAFRDYGIDIETISTSEATKLIQARSIPDEIVPALDAWANARRRLPPQQKKSWQEIMAVAEAVDPARHAMRSAILKENREELLRYATSQEAFALPPVSVVIFAEYLSSRNARNEAIALLRHAQKQHPGDFWVNHDLAFFLSINHPPRWAESIRFFTAAIAVRHDSPGTWLNLGVAFGNLGNHNEAMECCQQAIKLKPNYAEAFSNLAMALQGKYLYRQAREACRQAIALKPALWQAHLNLGDICLNLGNVDEAIAAYQHCIALNNKHAESYCNYACALRANGRFAEALVEFTRGHELGIKRTNWPYPSASWIRECQRYIELDNRLPTLIGKSSQLKSNEERIDLARLYYFKKSYLASARNWSEAFQVAPSIETNIEQCNRYDAACAAAQAGTRRDVSSGQLDEKELISWRKQALAWLEADLAELTMRLKQGKASDRNLTQQRLRHWQSYLGLSPLRDPSELVKWKATDQEACRQFWTKVERVLVQAESMDATNRGDP